MQNPLFLENDTVQVGADYSRQYNTGTLDTSNLTPRATLMRRDGPEVGPVQMGRIDGFNWAVVVSYAVTNLISPRFTYQLNIAFDNGQGNSIPHGIVTLTVLPGVPHP